MRIPPREVRYGGAMIDQKEIDAVVNVMQTGMSVGTQVQSFEKPLREAARQRIRRDGELGQQRRCWSLRLLRPAARIRRSSRRR
jgi:hypothetical protein